MAINYMAAERHCWRYMSNDQLLTRVKRLTVRARLDCFIRIADIMGSPLLRQAGLDRWTRLFTTQHILERFPILSNAETMKKRLRNSPPKKDKIICKPEFRVIR